MNRRKPAPTACVVTKFTDQGLVVSIEKPVYRPSNDEWEPDEVVNTLRVMAEQETGELLFVAYANNSSAQKIMDEHMASHVEHRRCWAESLTDKSVWVAPADRSYARTPNERRKTTSTMTDDHARRVMFGDLKNLKHGAAADQLGLTYGQVYSARGGYTFKHVKE